MRTNRFNIGDIVYICVCGTTTTLITRAKVLNIYDKNDGFYYDFGIAKGKHLGGGYEDTKYLTEPIEEFCLYGLKEYKKFKEDVNFSLKRALGEVKNE
ncbi:hypothetical protein [Campylobacter gastrosuis]|uniref:DUF4176 domain-containing protein n=1 Tax=Campylobacter gastrosuis TaxID=2974576 RepID=A0ABT7HSZ1_9BACT|nr:hypothetical protein [Campylobacter gastrosuis]MDL0089991.1 hypothetical protein [Campylobacter gastrosuis]